MTYSKDITLAHPLSLRYECAIETLDDLLIREGLRRGLFTPNEVVLDLDRVETERAKKNHCRKENTVDFSMGISILNKRTGREISPQILLVEAKLEVVKPGNIKASDLKEKIAHSEVLLRSEDSEVPLSKEKVFLFNDKCIGEAVYRIKRMFINNPNIKVFTTEEFKARYF